MGCGLLVGVSSLFEALALPFPIPAFSIQLGALGMAAPVACLLGLLTWLLSLVLSWVAPALAAVTIAREREAGTLDLLRVTLMTERSIVLGKLGGCLIQLWPAILTLALLSPFQLLMASGGGVFGFPTLPVFLSDEFGASTALTWVWLALSALIGLLKPWGNLSLHTGVGLFVSALSRSTGGAIAASYGAIIALRIGLYLLTMIINVVLVMLPGISLSTSESVTGGALMATVFVVPSLVTLTMVLLEFGGGLLLVKGATWALERL